MHAAFPQTRLRTMVADLTGPLALPPLYGLVMANCLHFVAGRSQAAVVSALRRHLRPGGRFVLVEYDADEGNPWVPYPLVVPDLERLAASAGLLGTRRIGRCPVVPGRDYAALSVAPPYGAPSGDEWRASSRRSAADSGAGRPSATSGSAGKRVGSRVAASTRATV